MKLLALAAAITLAIVFAFTAAITAALGGTPEGTLQGDPTGLAVADIPQTYYQLYRDTAQAEGLDWAVLAAIGKVETDHGRLKAPGVTSGENFAGAGGPMQFLAATWAAYQADGDGDGEKDRYNPADAILGAARYLKASGAPTDYRRAIFAYNHAGWYVDKVLAQADKYRDAPPARPVMQGPFSATVDGVLRNSNVILTPGQQADLRRPGIDQRLLQTMTMIGDRHTFIVTALRADHYPGTNHEAGRAMDIGSVDGEICRGGRTGRCATLLRELAAVRGALKSTELIYCWDGDPDDPNVFAKADHCDHLHVGWDA